MRLDQDNQALSGDHLIHLHLEQKQLLAGLLTLAGVFGAEKVNCSIGKLGNGLHGFCQMRKSFSRFP